MKFMPAVRKTCVWCVAAVAGILSLLAVIWTLILLGSP